MAQYAKITARTDDGRKTRIVKIVWETSSTLLGLMVNKDGWDDLRDATDPTAHEVQWLLEKALITKRTPMRMNLTYGELEEGE